MEVAKRRWNWGVGGAGWHVFLSFLGKPAPFHRAEAEELENRYVAAPAITSRQYQC